MKGMRWLAAGALAGVLAVAGCGGDDEKGGGGTAAKGGVAGEVTTWIMDPGSPKLQEVFKGYAKDFQAKHPGTKVNIEFVPWAQAHDKFTTAIAGGKVPDVAEMGTTWTPEFADQGAFEAVPAAGVGRLRLLARRRRDARRRGLGQAVVRRRPRADLPQGRPRAGRRRAPEDVGRAQDRRAGDQGEGRRHLPRRAQRPDRALLPAGHLAGGRRDRHAGRRQLEGRAELARGRRGDRLLHVLLQGGPDAEGLDRLGGARRAGGVHQRRRRDARGRRLDLQLDHPDQARAGEEDRHGARARRPERRGHRVRGRQPPRGVQGVEEHRHGERVRRLHARAGEPEQVHGRDRLPARDHGGHRGSRATWRTRSASRSRSSCSSTRRCTRRRPAGARSRARTSSTA